MTGSIVLEVTLKKLSPNFKTCGEWLGYCPPPVTVYIRGPIKGYIKP